MSSVEATRPSEIIWGLVCGYAEPLRSLRKLVMLKAYFDDSNMGQGTVAVLAGWCAAPTVWAPFADEWDGVLRMSPRIEYFKWSEWRTLSGQFGGISEPRANEKLNLLVNVLEHHKPLGIASVISNDMHQTIFGKNPDRIMRGPYFLSFYSVIAQLIEYLGVTDPNERVDFVFDIQPGQMDAATASWERFREVAPDHLKSFIGSVTFYDDVRANPLQAADLNAGWTREQAEYACFGKEPPDPPWGNRGSTLKAITRTWTEELYTELAKKTGAFKMPVKS